MTFILFCFKPEKSLYHPGRVQEWQFCGERVSETPLNKITMNFQLCSKFVHKQQSNHFHKGSQHLGGCRDTVPEVNCIWHLNYSTHLRRKITITWQEKTSGLESAKIIQLVLSQHSIQGATLKEHEIAKGTTLEN